ncbi:MAG: serine/threonine-protein kinase [Planctomycetota bacterium]
MVDPRKERAQDIYLQAIELDGAERDAFVRDACQGDEGLLVEVRRLLDAEDDVESKFLEPPSIPESTEPKPPPRLGEFVLIAEIGRGGMGVVYEARQVGLDRRVAVKLISRSLTTSEHDVLRFHREARNMAKLQHPGIVQVYTDGAAEQFHYFAMELVDGHDLAYELRLQRSSRADDGDLLLPPRDDATFVPAAARLVRDAALALQFAHQNGIVHRDIKPHNVLIGRDGRTRVADFGLARDENLGSASVTGEGAGTPHYMSPEQTRAATRVDFRTDVYSLGVVLYELLTFKRPFDGTTSADVQRAIRVEDPVPVRRRSQSVPLDLETICHQAMAREAGDRYQTAQQLADDLDRFLAHEAIVARPPGLAARAQGAAPAPRRGDTGRGDAGDDDRGLDRVRGQPAHAMAARAARADRGAARGAALDARPDRRADRRATPRRRAARRRGPDQPGPAPAVRSPPGGRARSVAAGRQPDAGRGDGWQPGGERDRHRRRQGNPGNPAADRSRAPVSRGPESAGPRPDPCLLAARRRART